MTDDSPRRLCRTVCVTRSRTGRSASNPNASRPNLRISAESVRDLCRDPRILTVIHSMHSGLGGLRHLLPYASVTNVIAPARRRRAFLAAALAVFGLSVGPALHGELHARDRENALERLFQIAFREHRGPGYSQELARAAEEALGAGAGHSHQHGAPAAEHGAGSLAHLALAVHPASPPPPLPPPATVEEHPAAKYSPAHLPPRYLVPDRAQGPPRG